MAAVSVKRSISAESREIYKKTRNTAKFVKKSYQIHVATTYLKLILATGAVYFP